jgi:acetyl-CoA carboxylase biotin carboxyl carrier protein
LSSEALADGKLRLDRPADHGRGRSGHVGALAVRLSAAHHLGPARQRDVPGAVAGGVVGHHDLSARKRPGQRLQRGCDPVRLVVRRDDHHGIAFGVRGQGRLFCRARPMDIQAHITGTVWKVEVAVGDQVDEGDTVVILESMKMEMPVEAEDPGTVTEIRCEEGQSVQEGDVLVVLG